MHLKFICNFTCAAIKCIPLQVVTKGGNSKIVILTIILLHWAAIWDRLPSSDITNTLGGQAGRYQNNLRLHLKVLE